MRLKTILLALALAGVGPTALAHTMWLNLVPDRGEQHFIASIGYGDYMPGSELLTNDWGSMNLSRYELVAPDGTRTPLGVPVVRFKVLRDGSAWTASGSEAQASAHNASFGDGWALQVALKYGEGEFRVPVAGAWRVDAHFQGRSGDYPALADGGGVSRVPGVDDADVPLYVQTSLAFNVKP